MGDVAPPHGARIKQITDPMAKKNLSRGRLHALGWLGVLLVTLLLIVAGVVFYSEWKLSRLAPGGLGESFPTKVFGAPLVLSNSNRVGVSAVLNRLARLDYRAANTKQ